LQPHLKACWCIPPEQNAEFVARMEDILDVYCLAYNPKRPVVCLDEVCKQLVKEVRLALLAEIGKPARYDYEYERNGVANMFLLTEPLSGWRQVNVTEHRTMIDWAYQIKELSDVHFPEAEKILLIMDNLNTHGVGSLYEVFEPEEARRLAKRLEIHYTPKHGSWLNVAEIELSALSKQCLNRRIPDIDKLSKEVKAWNEARNKAQTGVNWQFTTKDARIKLKKLYPEIKT
jgi:transposase